MEPFTSALYQQMQEDLKQVGSNPLQEAEQSYYIVGDALQQLKAYILDYAFRDEAEEIHFFKVVKPRFLKELIYFKELFHIEADKPVGSKDSVIEFYRLIEQRVNAFFDRNKLLYTYYRSGKTNYDPLFFLRDSRHPLLLHEDTPDMDTRFCTVGSFKLAKIQAYERLSQYIDWEIKALQYHALPAQGTETKPATLSWTDSKAGLLELVYGLQSIGAFNNAQAGLKQIVTVFERVFNVDLGNYSRAFQEMGLRKKSRTPFIDRMKEMLIKRMDEADDY